MKDLSIGKKLGIPFCVIFVLVGILSCMVLIGFNNLARQVAHIVDQRSVEQQLASRIEANVLNFRAQQQRLGLNAYNHNAASMQSAKESWNKSAQDAMADLSTLLKMAQDPESRKLIQEQKEVVGGLTTVFPEIVRLYEAGQLSEAQAYSVQHSTASYNRFFEAAKRLAERNRKLLEEEKRSAMSGAVASSWTAGAVLLLTLAIGVAMAFLIRHISRTLASLSAQMSEGSAQVAGAAGQVSSASQSLAQGTSEQAASLEETSSSTEEITSMTRKNQENSQNSAELMSRMSNHVVESNRKLDEMVASMKEINRSSEKIANIIKTIDEIAFQTNILALNAAVEAARAGEAGMGFAVVADEVRNLAQRCTQAAKDTASLIEESITKSAEGGRRLDEVASFIAGMTADAEKAKTMADEVHVGSQEQARGLEQVAKAITQMEQITQKTAANAEEGAAAGEELNAQSQNLQRLARQLSEFVGHATAAR